MDKKLYSIFILLLLDISFCFCQSVDDFRTNSSGNWNILSKWERWDGSSWVNPAPSLPSATSNVTIQPGHTITVNQAVNIENLDVKGTLTGNGANSLTTSGNFSSSGTVNFGSAGGDITIQGSLSINAGSFTIRSYKISVTNTTTISSGTFTDNNNNGTDTFTGLVTVLGSGAFTSTSVTTATNMLFNNGLTHSSSGTTALGSATITGNLSISQGALTVSSGNFSISGTTDISGGAFTDNNNGGVDTFTGLVTVSNNATWTTSSVTTISNLIFENGLTQSSSGAISVGSANFNTNSQNITITPTNGTGNISFARSVYFNVNTTISGTGTGSLTFSRVVMIAGSASTPVSLINQRTVIINGQLNGTLGTSTWFNDNGSVLYYNSTTSPMNTGVFDVATNANTVVYNNTSSSQTVKGTTYHHLTINKSGSTGTLDANTIVNGNLSITSGIFNISNFDFYVYGTTDISDPLTFQLNQ